MAVEDMIPTSKAGIWQQHVNVRTEKLEMDCIPQRTRHLLNSASPAFTSSFAYVELVESW